MSDREENLPTLAGLRARRVKLRTGRRLEGPESLLQGGLFSDMPELDAAPESGSGSSSAAMVPASAEGSSLQAEATVSMTARTVSVSVSVSAERRVWSVRELVGNVRQHVEVNYSDLWVEGEISNCRPAASGHVYFTLKDGEAQLPVVLFRRQAQLLRFRASDGLAVLVRGRISVYESRGQLQLIAETMEPRGSGALQLAFEQLKARLLAEGLFDAARKRALPAFPQCVGIITSTGGAVIRDIVTVVRRRHARLNLLVYPATMQGSSSPGSVAAGIRWFNANPSRADLIVIARGGGSMEDLACFNDEALARTIAASVLPVVSAIGHETDFTIADFVADLRAPTPSAAAEIITAAQHRIEERVAALAARVHRAGRYHLMHARQRYARLSAEAVLRRLRDAVDRRDQRLDELRLRLESAVQRRLRAPSHRLALLTERLRRQDIAVRIGVAHRRLEAAGQRMERAAMQGLGVRRTRLDRATSRLEALSPLAVLSRGYALVYLQEKTGERRLLRSSAGVVPGDVVHARFAEGRLEAAVVRTEQDPASGAERRPSSNPASDAPIQMSTGKTSTGTTSTSTTSSVDKTTNDLPERNGDM